MNNFLNFIEEDIEAKKTLIDTLPTRTKDNKRNFNEKIDSIIEKYEVYRASLLKYINSKSSKLKLKPENKNLEKLNEEVANLEHVRFVLNPMNTYIEKMGFDSLLYEINHYTEFQFDSLNKILNEFLDKFEIINVKLTAADFDYTCYVNEYMDAFLEVRSKKNEKYEKVSKTFEKIYWVNPNLIEHIELNLRSLIKVYSKDFDKYIQKKQKEVKLQYNIKNYDDCLQKLQKAYLNLKNAEEETIYDIVEKASNGEIEITDYLNDSKTRNEAYTSLSLDSLNLQSATEMEHFNENINKLKENLIEYSNYRQFIPLMMDFKSNFEKELKTDKKQIGSKLKEIDTNIKNNEKKLYQINKKISGKTLFGKKELDKEKAKTLKLESVNLANALYKLYKEYEQEYFKNKIIPYLNEAFTISNFLEIYYSFDYLKKDAITKVFKINNYDELINFSETFDLFAMNLNNIIMSGVFIFDKEDVSSVIVRKYRLSKINISDEDLHTDNIENLINKITLLQRVSKIENSEISVDKIWFMVKVKEINERLKEK